jgi:hypothetical protein
VEQTTYVLVPGGWHGGWAWRPVAERLRASGHRAVTLTLPGLGDGDDPSGTDFRTPLTTSWRRSIATTPSG